MKATCGGCIAPARTDAAKPGHDRVDSTPILGGCFAVLFHKVIEAKKRNNDNKK